MVLTMIHPGGVGRVMSSTVNRLTSDFAAITYVQRRESCVKTVFRYISIMESEQLNASEVDSMYVQSKSEFLSTDVPP